MRIDQTQINQIKTCFEKMKSREDLLNILNEAKILVYGDNAVPFDLKQITYYANPKLGKKRYFEFKIKKKSGAERRIHAPLEGLKSIQKTLSFVLQCVFEPHIAAMGFVRDRSIVDNAKIHVGSKYVYNIDLKDFFPSVDQARVWKCLQLKPFNLSGSRRIHANIIASICCTEMEVERKTEAGEWEKVYRNVLPQGAPTSPVLTNIVCQRLDYLLSGLAKRFGLKYSRYADDITFSSMHSVYQSESKFLKELHRIVAEQNFNIKESKTRLQKDGYRKEVTGLLVNEKVNVQQRYIKQLRMWLNYWERYGYMKASSYFLKQYISDKGHVKNNKPEMENVISGKLDYLKMVKGPNSELYLKLKDRFERLCNNPINEKHINRKNYLNTIINIAINKGLNVAMNEYKSSQHF
jgi:RNA-directed DNA polymerase